jgi:prevent-host-death family protein
MKHMPTYGIRALKQNASAVVAEAAAGAIITITDHGRPVAQIVPLNVSPLEQLIASGLASKPSTSIKDLPTATKLSTGTQSASEILAEMRERER